MDVRVTGATARLMMEPLEQRYAVGWLAVLADERVGQFIGGPDVTTLEAVEQLIDHLLHGAPPDRHESWGNWMLVSDGAVIGRIEATVHHSIAEVAYLLGPTYWGQGYATEAVRWLVNTLETGGGGGWGSRTGLGFAR